MTLVSAAVILGFSGGICLNGGLAMTVVAVVPEARTGVSVAFCAGLHLVLVFPAIGVGLLATEIGLLPSGILFAAVAATLAAVVAVAAIRAPRISDSHSDGGSGHAPEGTPGLALTCGRQLPCGQRCEAFGGQSVMDGEHARPQHRNVLGGC